MTSSTIIAEYDQDYKPATAPCPKCGQPTRFAVGDKRVSCRCGWGAALNAREAYDLLWGLTGCSGLDLGLFLAEVDRKAHPHQEPPVFLYAKVNGQFVKSYAPPVEPETPWARLMRLGEQARDANGVQVEAIGTSYTLFRVTSQRRGADGRPVKTYLLSVSDGGVTCHCDARAECGHIGALYLWLQEQRAAVNWDSRQSTRDDAQVRERARAAMEDLYGVQ